MGKSNSKREPVVYYHKTYRNQELFVTGAKASEYTATHVKPSPDGESIFRLQLSSSDNNFIQSIVQVACASTFMMFLTVERNVYGIGNIANNNYTQLHRFTELDGKVNFISAKTNDCFFATDNELYVIGRNEFQNAGIAGGTVSTISKINEFSNMQVVSVSCGYGHCIFLTNDNRVWVTGNNHFGQKGMNDRTKTGNYPVPESPILDEKYKIKSVHAGYAHNVLVTRDGEAIGYGHNMDRQLDDSGQDIHLPIVLHDVMKFGKVIDCSCGQYSAVFLLQNRNAVIRGKIGTKTYSVATLYEISLPIISLSVGEHALFAITTGGEVHSKFLGLGGINVEDKVMGTVKNSANARVVASMQYAVIYYVTDSGSAPFPFLYNMEKNKPLSDIDILVSMNQYK